MKMLIVEDDPFVQKVVKKVFAGMGFEVLTCGDGATALDFIKNDRIQFAVVDWILPEMDGLTLCRRARKLKLSRYIYMIVLTSRNRKEDLVQALDAGADDYIAKPFDETELAARARVGMRIIQLENKLINNQKRLMKLAREDPLTGILNRRSLFDGILKEINRASREGASAATILVDADNFKAINDTHGHLAGDVVLTEFSRRLQDSCREYDLLGRYGGEEFLVFLPRTDREGAIRVAERIRSSLREKPMAFGEQKIELSASLGVCAYTFEKSEKRAENVEAVFDEMIKRTDYALYMAKKEGKNRVVVYTP